MASSLSGETTLEGKISYALIRLLSTVCQNYTHAQAIEEKTWLGGKTTRVTQNEKNYKEDKPGMKHAGTAFLLWLWQDTAETRNETRCLQEEVYLCFLWRMSRTELTNIGAFFPPRLSISVYWGPLRDKFN